MKLRKMGYFEVDCREVSASGSWAFRSRLLPWASRVERLLCHAEDEGAPTVATFTRAAGAPASIPSGSLLVPGGTARGDWEGLVASHREFLVERRCGDWEIFGRNGNLVRLFELLGAREWVVFGNGLERCVDHVVDAMLGQGMKVVYLSDALVSSAGGHGQGRRGAGTPRTRAETLARWDAAGAVESTVEDFLARLGT